MTASPIGLDPQTAADVRVAVGGLLRQFVITREQVARYQASLAGFDLTQPPYSMGAIESATIGSALNGLNTALQAVDLTFINELTGLF